MQYNIMDYGALPDGKTNNQKQIQAAIEDCAKTGGRVLVPAGNFLSGTIQLKSNVELYLEKGSVLTASNSPEDIIDFQRTGTPWTASKTAASCMPATPGILRYPGKAPLTDRAGRYIWMITLTKASMNALWL